jgi:sarcosine oxidase subunit alpha
MSQKDRLGTGGRVNRAIPLTFTFNGRTYQGFQGDTLASALLANGVHFVARSFKYHRPRGIVTADVPNRTPSCSSKPAVHGAERTRDRDRAVPGPRRDERERSRRSSTTSTRSTRSCRASCRPASTTRPSCGRATCGRTKRRSAAAGLGKAPDVLDADRYDKCYAHCDVLVVGGGPSGLAAAHAAATAGARDPRRRSARTRRQPAVVPKIDGKPALQWVEDRGRAAQAARRDDSVAQHRVRLSGPQPRDRHAAPDRAPAGVDAQGDARTAVEGPREARVLATGAHERRSSSATTTCRA